MEASSLTCPLNLDQILGGRSYEREKENLQILIPKIPLGTRSAELYTSYCGDSTVVYIMLFFLLNLKLLLGR